MFASPFAETYRTHRTLCSDMAVKRTPNVWRYRFEDIANLLIENGADVNAADKDGRSTFIMLSHAWVFEHWAAVAILVPKLLWY